MKCREWFGAALLLATLSTSVEAQPTVSAQQNTSKYHITDTERAACQTDAMMLCSDTYPDEDRLLACLKINRPQLTQPCLVTFEAGMRRRHLPL